jgi:hypothetical protein
VSRPGHRAVTGKSAHGKVRFGIVQNRLILVPEINPGSSQGGCDSTAGGTAEPVDGLPQNKFYVADSPGCSG